MSNLRTIGQRSPMFLVFRAEMTLKSSFPWFCDIWGRGKAWWLPRPFSARYRLGLGTGMHKKNAAWKNCTLVWRRYIPSVPRDATSDFFEQKVQIPASKKLGVSVSRKGDGVASVSLLPKGLFPLHDMVCINDLAGLLGWKTFLLCFSCRCLWDLWIVKQSLQKWGMWRKNVVCFF